MGTRRWLQERQLGAEDPRFPSPRAKQRADGCFLFIYSFPALSPTCSIRGEGLSLQLFSGHIACQGCEDALLLCIFTVLFRNMH